MSSLWERSRFSDCRYPLSPPSPGGLTDPRGICKGGWDGEDTEGLQVGSYSTINNPRFCRGTFKTEIRNKHLHASALGSKEIPHIELGWYNGLK